MGELPDIDTGWGATCLGRRAGVEDLPVTRDNLPVTALSTAYSGAPPGLDHIPSSSKHLQVL